MYVVVTKLILKASLSDASCAQNTSYLLRILISNKRVYRCPSSSLLIPTVLTAGIETTLSPLGKIPKLYHEHSIAVKYLWLSVE